MADNGENNHSVSGTIYSIKKEMVKGKKDPTQEYPKYIFVLENKSQGERNRGDNVQYVTDTNLIEFELFNPRFDFETFHVKDFIFIRFYIQGQEFTYQRGDRAGTKGLINRNIPTFIKYADLDGGHTNHKGKVKVDASTDVKELNVKDPVFSSPTPESEDEFGDLPF